MSSQRMPAAILLLLVCSQTASVASVQELERRVTVGDGTVSGAYLEPYTATYGLTNIGANGDTTEAGYWTDAVRLLEDRTPHAVWRRVERFDAAGRRDLMRVQIVDRETLAPSVTHQVGPSDLVLHYSLDGRHVRLVHIPAPEQAAAWVHADSLREVPFDLALYALLLRGFPLREGASFTFPAAAVAPGQGVTLIEETLTVTGVEQMEVSGGQVEAWVVETALRPWVAWITREPPYIARIEQQLPDGSRWISVPVEDPPESRDGGAPREPGVSR